MDLMASLEKYHKAQKTEQFKKLTVICHLCNGEIGIINTETISLPFKGHMFESYAPERGVDPFFAPEADWENMWCKWGIPNAVDGHHPFPPTKVLTKEQGWYEPKGSSELIMCPLCKTDGVDSILELCPNDPGYAVCPIHGERDNFGVMKLIIPPIPVVQRTVKVTLIQFICEVCGKEHKSKKALNGHMKAHRKERIADIRGKGDGRKFRYQKITLKKEKEETDGIKRTGRKTANHSN